MSRARTLAAHFFILLSLASAALAAEERSVRLKDLVEIRGVRANQLIGIGLVVGLPGTGDSKASLATNKTASNLLSRLGTAVSAAEVTTKNVAVVAVTGELPPFARIGDRIGIRISSVGDAASLEGGTLVLTPLRGADQQIYAVAQGHVSLGTAMTGAQGGGGRATGAASKTVALSEGATVEREFQQTFIHNGRVELSLRNADFTTATRVSQAVNEHFGAFLAKPENAGLISITLPANAQENPSFTPVDFVATLEQIRVAPDSHAVVVVNERTGTIISGAAVSIRPVAISHNNLEIKIQETSKYVSELPRTATVQELVSALNALGAGPRDLVAILQALKSADALDAELRFL